METKPRGTSTLPAPRSIKLSFVSESTTSAQPAERQSWGPPRLFYCQQYSALLLKQREWMRLSRGTQRKTDDCTSQRERLLDWSSSPSGSNTTAPSKHCCCVVAAPITGAKVLKHRVVRMAEDTWVRSDQPKANTTRASTTLLTRSPYKRLGLARRGCRQRLEEKRKAGNLLTSLALIQGGITVRGKKVVEKLKKRIQSQRQLFGTLFSDCNKTFRWRPRRLRGNKLMPPQNLWNKILSLHLSVSLFAEDLLHRGWSQSGPYYQSEYLSLWDKLKLLFMTLIYESVK